jgi:hypothetical protein
MKQESKAAGATHRLELYCWPIWANAPEVIERGYISRRRHEYIVTDINEYSVNLVDSFNRARSGAAWKDITRGVSNTCRRRPLWLDNRDGSAAPYDISLEKHRFR